MPWWMIFPPKSLPDLVCLPLAGDDSDDVDDEAEPVQQPRSLADLFKHQAGQKEEYNNKECHRIGKFKF